MADKEKYKEQYDKTVGVDEEQKRLEQEEAEAARENEVEEQQFTNKLSFDDAVVEKIVGIAAREVDGILAMKGGFGSGLFGRRDEKNDVSQGVTAEVGEKQAAIDLRVVLEYGESGPEIFKKVTDVIKEQVKFMTGLEVVEVNLHVEDVMTRKEYDQKNAEKNRDVNEERVPNNRLN